jgi:eukaryotic-like serine/threonine-protein kinase
MPIEFHLRVEQILEATLRRDPASRMAYVQQACGTDERLRAEVESLLPHYEKVRDFEPGRPRGRTWKLPSANTIVEEVTRGLDRSGELRPPFAVGSYTVTKVLGRGGMGVVYRAQDPTGNEPVAIKVLRREFQGGAERLRFRVEEEILRQLQHPGIARFLALTTVTAGTDVRPCFVMEYIRGRPLTHHAAAQHLDVRARLTLLTRICDAVEFAHRRTIVHRDLKPDNILVDEAGQPRVLDFGLAQFADSQGWLPTDPDGRFAGTLAYASPEQRAGVSTQLTPASDVFALGVILHELLTGAAPVRRAGRVGVNLKTLRSDAGPPPAAEFLEYLTVIMRKAVAVAPAERYRSAGEFGAAIELLLAYDPAQSPWALFKTRLASLWARESEWTPSPTSRPLGAVLRTRIAMKLKKESRPPPEEPR